MGRQEDIQAIQTQSQTYMLKGSRPVFLASSRPRSEIVCCSYLKIYKKSQAYLSNIHVTSNNWPTVTNIRWGRLELPPLEAMENKSVRCGSGPTGTVPGQSQPFTLSEMMSGKTEMLKFKTGQQYYLVSRTGQLPVGAALCKGSVPS